MNFNFDTMPRDLDDAINLLLSAISTNEEIQEFKDPTGLHFGFGMWLRNNWSLWDKESHLVRWFVTNFGLVHADDISSIILEGVAARLEGEEFDPRATADRFKEHWLNYGKDPATMEDIGPPQNRPQFIEIRLPDA
jgi:hypothetical protein